MQIAIIHTCFHRSLGSLLDNTLLLNSLTWDPLPCLAGPQQNSHALTDCIVEPKGITEPIRGKGSTERGTAARDPEWEKYPWDLRLWGSPGEGKLSDLSSLAFGSLQIYACRDLRVLWFKWRVMRALIRTLGNCCISSVLLK